MRTAAHDLPESASLGPLSSSTAYGDYLAVGADRLGRALQRLARVGEGFRGELDAIGRELEREAGLSAKAASEAEKAGPLLQDLGGEAEALGKALGTARALVVEGRGSISVAVAEVQAVIDQLEARNAALKDILALGEEVSVGVARISEIAVENKLIAINAAVSSSKAGEKVRGFKVIADELSRLSSAMSGRVERIVEKASRVAARVDEISAAMRSGIEETRKALASIDQAYGLLDGIEESLAETEGLGKSASAENRALAEHHRAFSAAIASIDAAISTAHQRAEDIRAMTDRRDAAVEGLTEAILPYREAAEELSSSAGKDTKSASADTASADTASADTASAEAGAAPRVLRTAESALDNYDPALARMIRELHLASFTSIRLLRYSSDLKIVPYLALSWSLGEDGRTWTFRLAEDARFHDGSSVRSRDVKFSLERLLNPALNSPYAGLFSIIEGAEAFMARRAREVSGIRILGDHRISITLKDSFNYFLSLLALGYSTIIKEDPAVFSRPLGRGELLSAGPFRLLPSSDESTDILVANKDFVHGPPLVDRIEIRRSRENQEEALVLGELDLVYNLTASAGRLLRQKGFKGDLATYTSRYCYGLAVNFKRPSALARRPELRQALALAFDKEALVREDLGGEAIRADSVLSPAILDQGGKQVLPHDLPAARRLVDSLRGTEDLSAPFRIVVRAYLAIAALDKVSDRIRAAFASLGLRAEVELRPLSDSLASFAPVYDAVFVGFLPEIDLYSALEPFINPEGGDNYYGFSDPGLFAMLEATKSIKSEEERRARFLEILERLTRDVFMVPLFFLKVLRASSPRLRSVIISAEESFIPDAAFFAPAPGAFSLGSSERTRISAALQRCAERFGSLENESRGFQGAGRRLAEAIGLQREGIAEARRLFEAFAEGSAKVEESRAAMLARIRETTGRSAASGEAARLIGAGMTELQGAVGATLRILAQAGRELDEALSEVAALAKQDSFIGSIAVNAAIIAAKSGTGDGDLRKVSASIAQQASRNAEQTGTVRSLIERMRGLVGEHVGALEALAAGLEESAGRASEGAGTLERLGPHLSRADSAAAAIGEKARDLSGAVSKARAAVDEIEGQSARVSSHVEGLRFGMDLEQATLEVLAARVRSNQALLEALG